MVFTRHESMIATTKRHPAAMRGSLAADARADIGMTFEGFQYRRLCQLGGQRWRHACRSSCSAPSRATLLCGGACHPYQRPCCPAHSGDLVCRRQQSCRHTDGPTCVKKLGIDRLEMRRHNALRDDDRTVCGRQLQQGVGIGECLDALLPTWLEAGPYCRLQCGTQHGETGAWYRLLLVWLRQHRAAQSIDHGLHHRRRAAAAISGATDIGQGSNTVITQICADALGMRRWRILNLLAQTRR